MNPFALRTVNSLIHIYLYLYITINFFIRLVFHRLSNATVHVAHDTCSKYMGYSKIVAPDLGPN